MPRVILQLVATEHELESAICRMENDYGLRRNSGSVPVREDIYLGSEDLTTYHVVFFYQSEIYLDGIVDGIKVLGMQKI